LKYKSIFDFIEKYIVILIIILLSLMVIFIFSQVVARFIFDKPLSWTEEVSRHIMIWMAFLSVSVAYRHGSHLSINLIMPKLNENSKRIFKLMLLGFIIFFLIYMIKYGIELTYRTSGQNSSSLQYPMSYVYSSLPVSAVITLIFSVEQIINIVNNLKNRW